MTSPSTTTGGRTDYVVARTARENPDINGRTLYMSTIGLWTLDIEHARRFTEASAQSAKGSDRELRVVRAALTPAGGQKI